MERIILPMKVHAVKLEYRRIKMQEIIHGYFSTKLGNSVVVITYDPNNAKYCSKKPRVLRVTSKRGRQYIDEINRYLSLKSEYDSLLKSWNETYAFPPPKVKFPIKYSYDIHKLDSEYFKQQKENRGRYVPDNPTVSEFGIFKSKNELMTADVLADLGIPFKYETELYVEEANEKINPDFLLDFYEIDRCSYLEVLGMNDKFSYAASTTVKITSYSMGKYRPGREVIYVHLYDKQNFDKTYLVGQILSAYNCLIPDSALEWGEERNPIKLSSTNESLARLTENVI